MMQNQDWIINATLVGLCSGSWNRAVQWTRENSGCVLDNRKLGSSLFVGYIFHFKGVFLVFTVGVEHDVKVLISVKHHSLSPDLGDNEWKWNQTKQKHLDTNQQNILTLSNWPSNRIIAILKKEEDQLLL